MIIAASSDIHSPKLFDVFLRSVDSLQVQPDLFLLAGDVIDKGKVEEYEKISNVFFGRIKCPIVACFGNEEYMELRDEIRKKVNEIKFLDDESIILEINGTSVGIVGSSGSLDRPTRWQRKNIPNIQEIYENRVKKVDELLSKLKADFKILMVHYAPTYKILEGENPIIYPELGCRRFEKVILERKPDLVITGHSHKGKKEVWLDTVPIINVALPLRNEIVVIDTEKNLKPGLEKFF